MKTIHKSTKLANVLYDVRGPIVDAARQMEDEGQKIIKLNIGNLAPFGFEPPDEIVQDMIRNLPDSAGYSDSKGIFSARKAVMHYTQEQDIEGVTIDDIYLGNGASDLIGMATNALLSEGDEMLVPAPDYPLWTAVASLSGGKPVHYLCDEDNGWMPRLEDIRAKITPRTKALVVINPNNPTGALYSDELLRGLVQIAREHGLVIMADEVYDKVLYDGVRHTALASLSTDVLTLTFNSLSKAYRSCGFRAGWTANGRAPAPPARPGPRADHRHPRRQLRAAPGGAVHVPAAGPAHVPDPGRPPVLHGSAARHARDAGAGLGLQLPGQPALPHRVPAARGRPARGHRAAGEVPGAVPRAPRQGRAGG